MNIVARMPQPGTSQGQACLSVVMPCFNESATVLEVVERVLASPFVAELIVVDDASSDNTVELVRTVRDPRIRLLCQESNRGKGAALRRGFREASALYVIVQDADLEYDPAEYDTLLAPLMEGHADVVFGSRFQTSHARRVLYFWHSAGNQLLTLLSNMMTNLNLTDMETGYKAFRREVLESFTLEEDRFGIEPELTAKVARGGWRLYEVPISYHGRSYAEGKKIGWRDGMRALYCILRYSRIGDLRHRPAPFHEADEELASTLENLEDARNYTSWLTDLVAPHLGGRILDFGAGHGTFTAQLAPYGSVTALEPSARAAATLRERFAGDPRVEVVEGDASAVSSLGPFDTIVLINVLEHIDDDASLITVLGKLLSPRGSLVVLAPAHRALYSDFDRRVGHHRRYTVGELRSILAGAGLEITEARYVNRIGAISWFLFARVLGQTPTKGWSTRIFDRVAVPMIRLTERGSSRFGQSILAVGTASQ